MDDHCPETEGLYRQVLALEENDGRFERFANAIVAHLEGDATILSTSHTWDQNRDGTTIGGLAVVVCVSLAGGVGKKAKADLTSMLHKAKEKQFSVSRIYFATKANLAESSCDDLRIALAGATGFAADKITILPVGKLAELSHRKNPEVYRAHYGRELEKLRHELSVGTEPGDIENSLSLVLGVATSDDSESLRNSLWASLLRGALKQSPRSAREIGAELQRILKLSEPIKEVFLLSHVRTLEDLGQIVSEKDRFSLTEAGKEAAARDAASSAVKSVQGMDTLRAAIQHAISFKIADHQAIEMWNALEAKMSHLFFERGQEILALASSLVDSGDAKAPDRSGHVNLINALADAASVNFTLPDQKAEISTALKDLLTTEGGEAVDWFIRACYGYVAACCLGIEDTTRRTLEGVAKATTLVLDTDIVISFLCPGEPDYPAIREIVAQWRRIGGRVAVSVEVMAEVAYHAWIAQTDFEYVRDVLPGHPESRWHLTNNAFVRAFGAMLSQKTVGPDSWGSWIGTFRGASASDTIRVQKILVKEHKFELLETYAGDGNLQRRDKTFEYIKNNLIKTEKAFYDSIVIDKARKDSALFEKVLTAIEKGDMEERRFILVSSASRFTRIGSEEARPVHARILSIPAVLYIISLAPNVALGTPSLRSFLFDGKWHSTIESFDLIARRIIVKSGAFKVPWSRRTLLSDQLHGRLIEIARTKVTPEKSLRRATREVSHDLVDRTEMHQEAAKIISDSLKSIAVDAKVQLERDVLAAEVEKVRKRNRELEVEFDRIRKALSAKKGKD